MAACAALHNFIIKHDPKDPSLTEEEEEENDIYLRAIPSVDLVSNIPRDESKRADERRDNIAKAMWASYVQYRALNGYDDQ